MRREEECPHRIDALRGRAPTPAAVRPGPGRTTRSPTSLRKRCRHVSIQVIRGTLSARKDYPPIKQSVRARRRVSRRGGFLSLDRRISDARYLPTDRPSRAPTFRLRRCSLRYPIWQRFARCQPFGWYSFSANVSRDDPTDDCRRGVDVTAGHHAIADGLAIVVQVPGGNPQRERHRVRRRHQMSVTQMVGDQTDNGSAANQSLDARLDASWRQRGRTHNGTSACSAAK
jgi:hypothetical protein